MPRLWEAAKDEAADALLRIPSVLTLIHAVAVEAMKVNQFLLLGHMRTFWDFYHGMGLAATVSLTAEGVLFWRLG